MRRNGRKIALIIVILVFIIALIIGAVLIFINQSKKNDLANENQISQEPVEETKNLSKILIQDEFFDTTNPIAVKINNKYGYIDSTGSMMIEPKYEYARDFIGKYALVQIQDPNDTSGYKRITNIIDRQGNVKMSLEDMNYDDSSAKYGVYAINGKLYNLELEPISEDNIVINGSGKEGYYIYNKGNKTGIINALGESVYESDEKFSFDIMENSGTEVYAEITVEKNNHKTKSILNLLNGKIIDKLQERETFDKNGFGCYTIKDDEEKVKKLIVIKEGQKIFELEEENLNTAYWYDGAQTILKIYDKDGEEKYYSIKEDRYMNEREEKNAVTTTELLNTENLINSGYTIRGKNELQDEIKYGITDSEEREIIPQEFVGFTTLESDIYDYLYEKYEKIYVLAFNSEKSAIYDITSKTTITEGNNSRSGEFPKNSILACRKVSETSEDSSGTNSVVAICNLITGKQANLSSPINVKFGPTYFYMENDSIIVYYNSEFQKIYEINKTS